MKRKIPINDVLVLNTGENKLFSIFNIEDIDGFSERTLNLLKKYAMAWGKSKKKETLFAYIIRRLFKDLPLNEAIVAFLAFNISIINPETSDEMMLALFSMAGLIDLDEIERKIERTMKWKPMDTL